MNVMFWKMLERLKGYRYSVLFHVILVCLLFEGCIPENINLPSRVISVTTNNPANVTEYSATLHADVGLTDTYTVNCGIIYDVSSNLTLSNGTIKSTTANGNYSVNISGLKANTMYYYRAYAVDADVCKYGDVCSFKTDVSITTNSAIDITDSGVTLGGSLNCSGEELTCGIIYGTSSTLSFSSGIIKSTASSGTYSIRLSGLNANTNYYYCAYAIVEGKYKYGKVCSFKTLKEITVTTGLASNITDRSATVEGIINNSDLSYACGVIYGTSSTLSFSDGTIKSTISSGRFSMTLSELNVNTIYYYCAYVVDGDGEYKYGEVCSFKTSEKITVSLDTPTFITDRSATIEGIINNSALSYICGVIYGTSSALSFSNGTIKSTISSGRFSMTLSELNANTTYYYRAYVLVEGEYRYGDVCSFMTRSDAAIDLGLSVKWASYNIGAESPVEYGSYYAWGEVEEKSNYSWITYKWCNGSSTSLTKYCNESSEGVVDGKTTLDISDDVAHAKWGEGWRMPTLDEIKELLEKCSWNWTTINDVNGYVVTGPNGNNIFFPAAGYYFGVNVLYRGVYGKFWSNETRPFTLCYYAFYLDFGDNYHSWGNGRERSNGHTVRPVRD